MTVLVGGLIIYESVNAVTNSGEPRKVHAPKRWHTRRSYHERVQKKWLKRWGYRMDPAIFRTDAAMFVHPVLMKDLMRVIQTHDQ